MDTITLSGELLQQRVHGDDLWSIAQVKCNDLGVITATGKLLGASLGDTVQLEGVWVEHQKYGRQFKVKFCRVTVPQTDNGVVLWLSSKLPSVGKTRARQMLKHFGGAEQLWEVIENDPDRLVEVKGITADRANEIVDTYVGFRADRDRMIRFRRWGMTENQIGKVISKWGNDAEPKLRENPYRLADLVDGFGFIRADAIAQRMGIPKDAVPRIECGLMHTMKQAQGVGHCFVPTGKLVAMAADKVLHINGDLVALQLKRMRKDGLFVQHGTRTFSCALNRYEQKCADMIKRLLETRL